LHIIQRGNNRAACFYAQADYDLYLHYLGALSLELGCEVHAYVLMTNHVHLLLTPSQRESASLLMKRLGQRYVQHVNRTYGRSGTLWEGRFRSCIVAEESYLLRCYRYIEMNPVRAGMAADPRAYRWSSHRFNAGGARSGFLVAHPCYLELGASAAERRAAYSVLFRSPIDSVDVDEIRLATNANYALGSTRFQREVESAVGRRARRGRPGRPRGEHLVEASPLT
jgi:putative transposase